MTLREMRARFPSAFHPNQDWFNGEAFMDRQPRPWLGWPDAVLHLRGSFPIDPDAMDTLTYTAADLAALWLEDPTREMWGRYLWTNDLDHLGQRVFVGVNEGRMELHRHIHLTERFGVPV